MSRRPKKPEKFTSTDQRWKVLAPVDLSLDTEAPVRHAIDVAIQLAAELTLLYVVDLHSWRSRIAWPPSARGNQVPGLDIHRLVLPGPVSETIARYADFIDADLIVMNSWPHRRWNRFWRKPAASQLMQLSHRAIWVTSSANVDSDCPLKCKRIVCIADRNGSDTPVVQRAKQVAARSGAQLHICNDMAMAEHTADLMVVPRAPIGAPGILTADLKSVRSRQSCPVLTVPRRAA